MYSVFLQFSVILIQSIFLIVSVSLVLVPGLYKHTGVEKDWQLLGGEKDGSELGICLTLITMGMLIIASASILVLLLITPSISLGAIICSVVILPLTMFISNERTSQECPILSPHDYFKLQGYDKR